MAVLHNRVSNEELKALMMAENFHRITISFYAYFPVQNPAVFRDELYKTLFPLQVFGRIYVAKEGINAQISVPEFNFENFKAYLYSIEHLHGLRLNIAVDDDGKSFWVLKIKVRDKIVADGITDPTFSMENKGKYVNAVQMNELLQKPGTIVIDMRNHYEYEVGHFKGAIEIPSDTFREQLPMAADMMKGNEEKNIIMYCTGGIRCEKASAYMLHQGFKNVFHIGKNFVFDNRLGERITADIIANCHQCGKPADTHTNCLNDGCHLLFIQCETCAVAYEGCCSKGCQDTIHMPLERQKELRKGVRNGQHIFNKSKRLRPRLNEPED
jgi:UPF0176 protein